MVPPKLNLVTSDKVSNDNRPSEPDGVAAARADVPADAAALEAQTQVPAADANADAQPFDVEALEARRQKLRIIEALLFAAAEPLDEARLASASRAGGEIGALIGELQADYARRGVNLVKVAGKWAFRTAEDLSWVLERQVSEERRLSKAALETLAIIAYHQPVTRAEIEEIRGVSTSAGTLDILLETRWVRPRGRRRAPGRPVTYGTTESFLEHFGLDQIKDLPGLAELKGSGLLDANLPPGFTVPEPTDVAKLMPDELPLDAGEDEAEQTELALEEAHATDEDGPQG